ncbi:L-lactate/malate dehydrogenase [Trichoderma austrokoningii]
MHGSRIAIVGVGQVGAGTAFTLIPSSVAAELLLVDDDVSLRDGQVCDLSDVAYSCNSRTKVRAAGYQEAGQCDIIVIAAGSRHTIGQSYSEHVHRNISAVRTIVDGMMPLKSDAVLLVVSDPVDLLTSLVLQLSQLPPSQVLGSGTYLDSIRLRGMLADRIGIAAESIDVFVLGVQGESQVAAWSAATIKGVPINASLSKGDVIDRSEFSSECKHRSQSIIRAKGAAPFGMASVVSSICSSVILDKGTVHPISHFQPSFGCCFSSPVVLGRGGIQRKIQVPLDFEEDAQITDAATALKKMIDQVNICNYVDLGSLRKKINERRNGERGEIDM